MRPRDVLFNASSKYNVQKSAIKISMHGTWLKCICVHQHLSYHSFSTDQGFGSRLGIGPFKAEIRETHEEATLR